MTVAPFPEARRVILTGIRWLKSDMGIFSKCLSGLIWKLIRAVNLINRAKRGINLPEK